MSVFMTYNKNRRMEKCASGGGRYTIFYLLSEMSRNVTPRRFLYRRGGVAKYKRFRQRDVLAIEIAMPMAGRHQSRGK